MLEFFKLLWSEITNIHLRDPRCSRCGWRIRSIYPGHLCVGCYDAQKVH